MNWISRICFLFYSIKTCRQNRRKYKIWVRWWIRNSVFQSFHISIFFSFKVTRDSYCCRSVCSTPRNVNWRFISRHESVIWVSCWVCNRSQSLSMIHNSTTKVAPYLTKFIVFIFVIEHIFSRLPKADIGMHSRTWIHGDWFRHHCSNFFMQFRYVSYNIFVRLGTVSSVRHFIINDINLTLSCSSYFVMMVITQNPKILVQYFYTIISVFS